MAVPLTIFGMARVKLIDILKEVEADIRCVSSAALNQADQADRVIAFEDSNLDDLVALRFPDLDRRGDQAGQAAVVCWLCQKSSQHVPALKIRRMSR
jgi:hypothetical protein